ncbi:MAG TPA: hypothetical protein VFO21_24470 [Vicinamibacterales bacterium]|nr:hypothetical protein [Vicinamibacterales bacterium]
MYEPTRREFLLTGLAVAASPSFAGSQAGDLATLTVKQASDLIRRRDVSALALTEACLRRIDLHNPSLNAFVTMTEFNYPRPPDSARYPTPRFMRTMRRG